MKRFCLPGDADFPLNMYYSKPKNSSEFEELRKYVTQLRQEIGNRLVDRVFDPNLTTDGKPSKWWICFSKRKFMKVDLNEA